MKKVDTLYWFLFFFLLFSAIVHLTSSMHTYYSYAGLMDKAMRVSERRIEIQKRVVQEQKDTFDKKIKKLSNQISVLEESVDYKNKRWAKIKQIRSVVKSIINSRQYKNALSNIKDLTTYAASVLQYSEEYDVPISLVLAVTRQESAFSVRAVSHKDAKGLMQLIDPTARECASDLGKKYFNLYKISDNVQLGVWYLWKMLNRFENNVEHAVQAYNAGPTYVKKYLDGEFSTLPAETVDYSAKVLQYKKEFEELGL